MRELYERLLKATEEATRYKAIAESSESTKAAAEELLKARIAELAQERDAAAQEASEAAPELAKLRGRGFWARLFSAG